MNCPPRTIPTGSTIICIWSSGAIIPPSDSYFKFIVHALRFAYLIEGKKDKRIELPTIKRSKKLPRIDMILDNLEFIRRFSMHILPKGLVRIRHFGILESSAKQITIPLMHRELGLPIPEPDLRIREV